MIRCKWPLHRITLLIAGCTIGACDRKPSDVAAQAIAPSSSIKQVGLAETNADGLTAQERTAIAKAVTSTLKDPSSAQFEWYPKQRAGSIYCGRINAKNGFGGYTGFKPYSLILIDAAGTPIAGVVLIGDDVPGSGDAAKVIKSCKEQGYPVDTSPAQ